MSLALLVCVLCERIETSQHGSKARMEISSHDCFFVLIPLASQKHSVLCADVKCADTGNNVLMSPEQGVFGYGSIDLLAGDEEDDVFNP